ncbi:hypothetical protein CEXT_546281 [Caerostris extrusa]|uniref:Uncharacterized protein n=1 Tax=Caerostris extrusa TaxID=172846 RepID=A0AAV4SLL8_CAEEX|nr:hypothetical protein CEXT_546281 [Caerostris extrusa]
MFNFQWRVASPSRPETTLYVNATMLELTLFCSQPMLNRMSFNFKMVFEVIAGIGCALCAFFVFLTFFILLVLWRKISGAITALKIQVCIALIGAYATILKALHESLTKVCIILIKTFN